MTRPEPKRLIDILEEMAQNPAYDRLGVLIAQAKAEPASVEPKCWNCGGAGETWNTSSRNPENHYSIPCRPCRGTGDYVGEKPTREEIQDRYERMWGHAS